MLFVCFGYMCVYSPCACLKGSRLKYGVLKCCELPSECWEWKARLLHEQVLLATEIILSLQYCYFKLAWSCAHVGQVTISVIEFMSSTVESSMNPCI